MFFGGISTSTKVQNPQQSFLFAKNLDIYKEPTELTLNVRTVLDSEDVVEGLIKWIVAGDPYDDNIYFYSEDGSLYQRDSGGTYTDIRDVSGSHGQGLEIFNDYLYYIRDTDIGRYGPLSGVPSFDDTWLTVTLGKAPLNDTSTKGFAPIKAFRAGFAVGNGNDLGWWDGSVWIADRIVLPPGFNINTLEIVDEYLVIAAWEGTSYEQFQSSMIFFWDGDSTTFNFFQKVEAGPIGSMISVGGKLFAVIGGKGIILNLYPTFQELHQIPKIARNKFVETYPGAITSWHNIIHFGVASSTDSDDIIQGVYQYGSMNSSYPDALNFGYTASLGYDTGTGVRIGAVKVINDALYFSWVTGSYSGIDKVDQTGPAFAKGEIEFLIFDDGKPTDEDMAIYLKALYSPLIAGEAVQISYKTDRAISYTDGIPDTTVGSNIQKLSIDNSLARFQEFQWKITMTTSVADSPTIFGVGFKYDTLTEETKVT